MTRAQVVRGASVFVGIGGIVTLGLAVGLVLLQGEVPVPQRIGAAIVPTGVGVTALWFARRLWRLVQRKTT